MVKDTIIFSVHLILFYAQVHFQQNISIWKKKKSRAKRALCDKNLIIKLSTFTEHSLSLKKSALIGNSFTNKHRNNFFYIKIDFSKILNFKANFLNLTKCHIRPFSLWTHDMMFLGMFRSDLQKIVKKGSKFGPSGPKRQSFFSFSQFFGLKNFSSELIFLIF